MQLVKKRPKNPEFLIFCFLCDFFGSSLDFQPCVCFFLICVSNKKKRSKSSNSTKKKKIIMHKKAKI